MTTPQESELNDRRAWVAFRNRLFWIGLALVLAGLFRLAGWPYFPWLNLAAFYLMLYLLIPPHELAHVLAAWLTRTPVFEVRYGTGPLVRAWRVRGCRLALHRYPSAAGCLVPGPGARPDWRAAIVALAGPLFYLLLALALAPGFRLFALFDTLAGREVVVLACLVMLLAQVLGRQGGAGELPGPSDIGRAWDAIRGSRD